MKKQTISLILFFCLLSIGSAGNLLAGNYTLIEHVSYLLDDEKQKDDYCAERCNLDMYYPNEKKGFKTVIWFHGGGLETGGKFIPDELKNAGICVVSVDYRLHPRAKHPAYIDDAANAVAWVFKNIENYGGDKSEIYVSGHSAGGYLTLMVGLDKSYLNKYGIDANDIKGLIPISGQTNTHWTIRKEYGMDMNIPYVDKYAPLNQVREHVPPTLLITGDRNLEMIARYEENAHLEAVLKSLKNNVTLYELQGFDHNDMLSPACKLLVKWIKH